MKKRSLTLIEIMIALGLAGLLLTTLFSFYQQLFITRAQLQKSKEVATQRIWVQERLIQVFSQIATEVEEDLGLAFYLGKEASAQSSVLNFYYDNGMDPDPHYSGVIKAMLFLNQKKELLLQLSPSRKEVLMEGVKDLQVLFFDPKEKVWGSDWENQEGGLPPMIKLTLTDATATDFVFFLPSALKKISYKKK